MKTIKYLAEKNCKVKINGVFYSGDKVIPSESMSDEEIKKLLAARFIRKVTLDEDNGNSQPDTTVAEKKLEEMNKGELIAKAKKAGIVTDKHFNKLSEAEMRQKIAEATAEKSLDRTALLAKAAEKGLTDKITDAMTDEEIQKLIAEAQG